MLPETWTERVEALENEVSALYLAMRDRRTPVGAKLLVAGIVAYAVSPVDPIPDVIPVVGHLDELIVLPVGIALARRLVPETVMDECRDRAAEEIDVGWARWIAAGLVVLVWAVIGLFALRAITDWP